MKTIIWEIKTYGACHMQILVFNHFSRVIVSKHKNLSSYCKPPTNLVFKITRKCCLLVQFSSVTQSCPALCDPMNCSTPGVPVHHQLPEFTQTHVHWVGDAIQPSHPLSSPSPPAINLSQHQGLSQLLPHLPSISST